MAVIIGIDPGSRITGYGLIKVEGNRYSYVASGCIRVQEREVPQRLVQIFSGLQQVIAQYNPSEGAIEQVFMHRNPNSALKLGQARGVAMASIALQGIEMGEYSARQIKQSVVGYGAASKEQVQHMVKTLLALSGTPQADAADALAVALCHAQSRTLINYQALLEE